MKVQRTDRIPVKALRTDEGFIYDPNAVLTRSGIFEYRDPKTGKVTREYRPDEEIFNPGHLKMIEGLPITEGHRGKVNSGNARQLVTGAVLGVGRQDGKDLVAAVKIFVTDTIDKDGFTELSLGYDIDLDETPGEINGERYDAIQRNPVPNHLAVVRRGRAGNARLNLDAADDVDDVEGAPQTEKGNMKKVRLDNGLEYDAAPEVAVYIEKLVADVKAANAAKEAALARADAADAKATGLTAEIEKAKVEGQENARKRLQLEAIATQHKVQFKADTADNEIKVGVIKAIRGDSFDPEGRTDAYIDASFDIVIKEAGERNDAAAGQRREMTQGTQGKKVDNGAGGSRNDGSEEPKGAAGYKAKMLNNIGNPGAAKK